MHGSDFLEFKLSMSYRLLLKSFPNEAYAFKLLEGKEQ